MLEFYWVISAALVVIGLIFNISFSGDPENRKGQGVLALLTLTASSVFAVLWRALWVGSVHWRHPSAVGLATVIVAVLCAVNTLLSLISLIRLLSTNRSGSTGPVKQKKHGKSILIVATVLYVLYMGRLIAFAINNSILDSRITFSLLLSRYHIAFAILLILCYFIHESALASLCVLFASALMPLWGWRVAQSALVRGANSRHYDLRNLITYSVIPLVVLIVYSLIQLILTVRRYSVEHKEKIESTLNSAKRNLKSGETGYAYLDEYKKKMRK